MAEYLLDDLTAYERLILIYLYLHKDYPKKSINTIQMTEFLGCSKKTALRIQKRMELRGLVILSDNLYIYMRPVKDGKLLEQVKDLLRK